MFNKDIIDSFKTIETPFYYYDLDILSETLERLIIEADSKIFKVHYALKANTNSKLLNLIRSYGLGIDAVSGNEVKKSIEEAILDGVIENTDQAAMGFLKDYKIK